MRALRLEMLADSPLAFIERLADAAARPHHEYAELTARTATSTTAAQFIAESAGRFLGHAGGLVPPDDPNVTVVFAVYVTPAWRGSGLLDALIDAVASWSRAVGRSELRLEVMAGNDRARRAYERLGFTDTGVRLPHPTIPVLTEVQMRRPA